MSPLTGELTYLFFHGFLESFSILGHREIGNQRAETFRTCCFL